MLKVLMMRGVVYQSKLKYGCGVRLVKGDFVVSETHLSLTGEMVLGLIETNGCVFRNHPL